MVVSLHLSHVMSGGRRRKGEGDAWDEHAKKKDNLTEA
jgi:hypothetical protein